MAFSSVPVREKPKDPRVKEAIVEKEWVRNRPYIQLSSKAGLFYVPQLN